MILSSSILLGFVRLVFLLMFLYYCNNKLVKREYSHNLTQFIVNEWFKYGSLSLVVVFVLIQLSVYSLINYVLIMLFIILIDVVGIKNFKNPVRYFKEASKSRFFEFLKDNENRKPLREVIRLERPKKLKDDRVFIFYATLVLIVAAFIGRYYFYTYDTYLLSDLWISNLNKVILFDENNWFNGTVSVEGELAVSNLYSKLVDISPEVGLQSLAILEDILLSLIVFWAIRKITTSKVLAPMIAFLTYVFLYTFSPIEIHYLLQNEPVLMGLTFAIPSMVYILKPDVINFKKTNFFMSLVICFFAIGLIDLFTLLILMPPFFIIALVFVNKNYLAFKWIALVAYIIGTAAVLTTYYLMCQYYQNDFLIFLQSSLISVTSFTYMPNLIIPFEELLKYYQYGSLFSIIILPFLIWYKKEEWKPSLVFMLYFNLLVTLSFIHVEWIDTDLLRLALSVFIPICFGISVAVILRLLFPLYKRFLKFKIAIAVAASLLVFSGILFTQITPLQNIKSSDKTPRMVLDAYDKILHEYFPNSYAVVNDNIAQTMSVNKHFFINYEDFLFSYLDSDSIYHHNRKKPRFFVENPQYVIPKSVLVFVYHDNTETENHFADQNQLEPLLKEHINTLEKRGRNVSLYYESPYVNVYEIVNEPKSSKIDDLIY
ncbi:hypothetical protein [Flavobacterium sp.]|jgi:hypothetical protein|uniref:hypothetical protein n=1 Tax=Flavobacterium sp. TaxID=239 RepID=UPI0037C14743